MINKITPNVSSLAETFIASAKKSVNPYENFMSGSLLKEFSAKNPIAPKVENAFDKLAQTTYAQRVESYAVSHGAVGSKLNVIAG